MNISIFLAKAFGLYLVIMGIGMLVNPKHIKRIVIEFLGNSALLFLGGVISLILGILLILVHNIWVFDWRIIITLLAWLTFIKGFMNTLFPLQDLKINQKVMKGLDNTIKFQILSGVYILLGLVLCYVGFFS